MVESGLPQLALSFSAGLLAPAGTPAEIVDKLNVEINEAMKTPELAASMAKLGFEPTNLVAARITRPSSPRKRGAGRRS